VGIVSATTVGGMDRSELFYKDFLQKEKANPFIDTHHAGNSTEKIAETLGISDYVTTISTACSSSLNSIMFGARLLKNDIVDKVVVGGTDALSKFTLNGFNTLMILDKNHCRPFDETRTGLNLGEGAAYLVLEKEESALKSNKHIYAEVSGYANANDAFHQTASSEDGVGPFLAMENALKVAGLSPDQIDYINVHGTGTGNNDLTEGIALQRLFKNGVPLFSSTKAYTGHTLGAAGTVESIISILALENNKIFPNLNFSQPIEKLSISPETTVLDKELNHVLTNSFGFGGNDSSVLFSKYKTEDRRLKTEDYRLETEDCRLTSPIYINGIGSVAPVETIGLDDFSFTTPETEGSFLQVLNPGYRDFIDPKTLRRMSKIVRMGIVSAKLALKDASIDEPDAIITGTGMGCQVDTEKFLNSMLENNETLLNPTSFIQSTHNTIGAQIALLSGNNNYNFAYVHRTFSFESALLDSILQLSEDGTKNILLGGVDEITEESWLIKTKIGHYKRKSLDSKSLFDDSQTGSLAGESASFFVLSGNKTSNTYARVSGVETFFQPESQEITIEKIASFLTKHHLKPEEIDLVVLGYNGDQAFDTVYQTIENSLFEKNNIATYKQLCGEHDTSSAFATWLAAGILKKGKVPSGLIKEKKATKAVERVLIYNHFRNINHSLILLEKA
jgi:3-oxoacyl-(acyl-carrier-protein) synthase